jgi:hypothetical protein
MLSEARRCWTSKPFVEKVIATKGNFNGNETQHLLKVQDPTPYSRRGPRLGPWAPQARTHQDPARCLISVTMAALRAAAAPQPPADSTQVLGAPPVVSSSVELGAKGLAQGRRSCRGAERVVRLGGGAAFWVGKGCSAPSVSDTIDQPNRVMDGLDRPFHPSTHLLHVSNKCTANY